MSSSIWAAATGSQIADSAEISDARSAATGASPTEEVPCLGLVIVWSRSEPDRLGDVCLIQPGLSYPGKSLTLGRYSDHAPPRPATEWIRQRPGRNIPRGPLTTHKLNRTFLKLRRVSEGSLEVENVGERLMRLDSGPTSHGVVCPGDLIELYRELLLLCVIRPQILPELPANTTDAFGEVDFGAADTFGFIGESYSAWAHRARLARASGVDRHTLFTGPSGAGKELAASAIHQLSHRRTRRQVAANLASLPESLVEAELFGNRKDYPNPGTPERPGLIGEADGSSLLLDEIGEVSQGIHAKLLRVLDDGEYRRIGDLGARRVDLRLLAATNRPPSALKHDLVARLSVRIVLPDLNARLEDIPLLAAALLRSLVTEAPDILRPLLDASGEIPIPIKVMKALVLHRYETHVRELKHILWQCIDESLEQGSATLAPCRVLREGGRSTLPLHRAYEAGLISFESWRLKMEHIAFDPTDRERLADQRRNDFNLDRLTDDPTYPVAKAQANNHRALLIAAALAACEWNTSSALALLAAEPTVGGFRGATSPRDTNLRRAMRDLITNILERPLSSPAGEELGCPASWKSRFGARIGAVLAVWRAAHAGHLTGALAHLSEEGLAPG